MIMNIYSGLFEDIKESHKRQSSLMEEIRESMKKIGEEAIQQLKQNEMETEGISGGTLDNADGDSNKTSVKKHKSVKSEAQPIAFGVGGVVHVVDYAKEGKNWVFKNITHIRKELSGRYEGGSGDTYLESDGKIVAIIPEGYMVYFADSAAI